MTTQNGGARTMDGGKEERLTEGAAGGDGEVVGRHNS
jgi:hypothetical protein